jgi:hypothetical protein
LIGRRYILPREVAAALEQVFREPVNGIVVIENSLYARAHRGMRATTRRNRILLAGRGEQFVADPELLLHEYCHVVRQWRTGYLTRRRYIWESMWVGYWANRYEREAREFTAAALKPYLRYLKSRA